MKRYPLPRGKLALMVWISVLCWLMKPALGRGAETAPWIAPTNNAFAAGLYAKLAASEQGNLFFSPASIETALAMTYAGARGETATQMAAVLHIPVSGDALHKDLGGFLERLNGRGADSKSKRAYELSISNALWGQRGFAFLPPFLELVKSNYDAGLKTVDFADDTEGARSTINAWIEARTDGKIKDLIAPGVLDNLTRLVLTDAIYFKGTWSVPFDKAATQEQPFHLSGKGTKDIQMMQKTDEFAYMEDREFQAVKLDYKGDEVSMLILLPRSTDHLPRLEREISPEKLAAIDGKLSPKQVAVSLPRFQLSHAFELGSTLQAMGMKDAFTRTADFSGMTGKPDLCISRVIHKAFVDVNEKGTEAAASTAIVMEFKSVLMQPEIFRADHPFLFLIRDESSGAILFMGRLVDPGQP